ncbi:DEKNAAC101262 [Brettanomyces naardenensis]|uniref:non-specific serine/threonine protein kinase n=1 Tax=Brettanomyces naardenensis TaxID=13370 RepID=A0A448YHK1_BRENA|nr:DEKNAAC101262 [Brettanomyces naardenensis]
MSLKSYVEDGDEDEYAIENDSGSFKIYTTKEEASLESREAYRKQTMNRLALKSNVQGSGIKNPEVNDENKENLCGSRKSLLKYTPVTVTRKETETRTSRGSQHSREQSFTKRLSLSSSSNKDPITSGQSSLKSSRRLSLMSLSSNLSNTSANASSRLKSIKQKLRGSNPSHSSQGSSVSHRDSREKQEIDDEQPLLATTDSSHTMPESTADTEVSTSQPHLTKKNSRFRLRHSISLRTFTSLRGKEASTDLPSERLTRRISLSNIGHFLFSGTTAARRTSVDLSKCEISSPVPQHDTREKLNNKLRNSSSILSISSFISTSSSHSPIVEKHQSPDSETFPDRPEVKHGPMRVSEIDSINQKLLLRLCNQGRVVSFDALHQRLVQAGRKLTRIAKTPFSDVYVETASNGNDTPLNVLKVIPFGDIHSDQLQLKEVIQELSIMMVMSPIEGYARMKLAKVVRGPYPAEISRPTKRLGDYSTVQLYLVLRMEYGGVDLEHFNVSSWTQAYSIISQAIDALVRGERANGFEHRDLHWGNVLVQEDNHSHRLRVKLIDFALSRARVGNHIMFTGLDNPNFFKGKGDYQFTTYRLMRKLILGRQDEIQSNEDNSLKTFGAEEGKSESQGSINQRADIVNWSLPCPETNLLWIRYLLDRIINHKNLKPVRVNPITRSSRSSELGEKEMALEVENCNRLMSAYKVLEPTSPKRKMKGRRRKKTMRSLEDFGSTEDFSKWFYQL